ncbi:zinc ribbon domain-containing protein [Chakrabartyella piscis]|uniref:zinc ribbon domain-containing protein n=1 Tax=Chakrabartyella piscis TaxID=2918914 RepID=UPI002958BB1A|nr:zinc ribbon domain-containing protein [Chakrabartyella piscis]
MEGIVIILIILLLTVGGIAYVVYTAKQKVEEVSRSLFGTSSIKEGLDAQAEELSKKPKSVSAMTRVLEPQIARDFPEFNWVEFRNTSETILQSALVAISCGDLDSLGDVSLEIYEKLRVHIAKNKLDGIEERYTNIRIHQTEIARYDKIAGKCIITLQTALEYQYTKKKHSVLDANYSPYKTQTKYNMEMMYIQDASLANMDQSVGVNCPNCGAPITSLGQKKCEYCGLAVTPINIQVWNLQNFYEVTYQKI